MKNNLLKLKSCLRRIKWYLFIVILLVGVFSVWRLALRIEKGMRDELLVQAQLVVSSINTERITTLTGTEADLASPDYLRRKEMLATVITANKKCRFAYLMGRRQDGNVFFYADSEPIGSKDESPAGQLYTDIPSSFLKVFETGKGSVEGPATDRWGTWVTALAPLTDPTTGELIAVLGMDFDAHLWKWNVAARTALPTILIVVILFLILVLVLLRERTTIQKENELKYRTLFENMGDAIFIMKDDKFVDCNLRTLEVFGCQTPNQILGHSPFEFSPTHQPNGKESRKEALEHINDALKGKTQLFEWVHNRLDGSEFFAEIRLNKLELNNQLLLQAIVRDISERKHAEAIVISAKEHAELNERKLKEAQEHAKMGSWELDIQSGIFTFTDSFYKIFHTTATQMGGYKMTIEEYAQKFVHPDDAYMVAVETQLAIESKDPNLSKYIEHRILYDDGGVGYISVRLFVVKDEYGKTIKTYGVNQDITEKKLVEVELINAKNKAEESDKLKSHFLNTISHEVRTPLNGILGFADFFISNDLSASEKLDIYKVLQISINRLLKTVDDIVDMSLIKSGLIKLKLADVHVIPFLESYLTRMKELCGSKNIIVNLDIPVQSKDIVIVSDSEILGKIVWQLLLNAEKFTAAGRISFGFTRNENEIQFFVKDTGQGIAGDKLDTVFKPFVHEDMSSTRKHEGSGLGLTIAYALVELLGGKMRVESKKGEGSVFYFMLPAKSVKPAEDLQTAKFDSKLLKNDAVILLAEDDEVNAELLETYLHKQGFTTLHAWDGLEAVEMCQRYPEIALIFMDIKMPVMDGVEATKRIKDFRPELPILAVTAYAQLGDKNKMLEAGCDDYLAKPFNTTDLNSITQKYFNKP